ncbi:MAG: FliM/FliN family flagellar motor switch protein [Deltaproteobacteria bacterium]|nr:FliM/FliN family flagellar motor switch protein [Deltaproteobacteria bacterium]
MSAFPFPLPRIASGFATLSPAARLLGREAAAGAAGALSRLLGEAVTVEGRPLPAAGSAPAGLVRLPLELEALPARLSLEVDAAFAVRLVDRVAGGDGQLPPALDLTPLEWAAVELLALVAIDGAAEVPAVAALAPRLRGDEEPLEEPLAVDLALSAAGLRGRARLLLAAPVLRRLAAPAPPPAPAEGWLLDGWLESGSAALPVDDLATLAPGDVVLLDEPPGPRTTLAFPGFALPGREEEGHFVVEDLAMERSAASLPVTLAVEVARLSLTLGELWRLEPGSALPLPAPRDGSVVLRLDGRPVARGQLVDIEGALGVRIEALEGQP